MSSAANEHPGNNPTMAVSDKTRRTVSAFALSMVILLAAACGGSDGDTANTANTVGEIGIDDNEAETGNETEAGSDADRSAGAIPARAVVTIGGERFEATEEIGCFALSGALSADFTSADGSVDISINLPPEDWATSTDSWSPPSVRVDDNRDPDVLVQWEAGSELFPEVAEAQVLSFSVDGKQGSGSATMLDTFAVTVASANGDPKPEAQPATFEVACE